MLAALDPRWAGGRPRLISDDDVERIVAAATTRPEKLARWIHDYLAWHNADARHPDVLAAQHRERARIRSERHASVGVHAAGDDARVFCDGHQPSLPPDL